MVNNVVENKVLEKKAPALENKVSQRNGYIDFARGIAIFLMIWGHCLQYCIPKGADFFEDPVFKFIYTFHMPILALISGYMFSFSVKNRGCGEGIGKRTIGLAQALVVGSLVNFAITKVIYPLSFDDVTFRGVLNSAKDLWFLWSILGASIAVSVAVNFSKSFIKQLLLIVLMIPIIYVLPGGELNLYMYPYFVLGWIYFEKKDSVIFKLLYKIRYICIPVFIVMLFFFEKKHYIYTSGMFTIENIAERHSINLFRYLIGFFGSICMLIVCKWLFDFFNLWIVSRKVLSVGLSNCGRKSLQIYIISCSLLSFFLPKLARSAQNSIPFLASGVNEILYDAVLTPIVAIVYIAVLYWIVILLEKIKLSKVLFGR